MRHLIDYQADLTMKNPYKATISKEMQDLTDPRLRKDYIFTATAAKRYRDLRRPRVVVFYKNGDRNFKGKTMHITPHRYLTFQELLSDLTKSMNLPYGVRQIYTPLTGTRIRQIEDLKNGESYVCASFEAFRRIKYGRDEGELSGRHHFNHWNLQNNNYILV